MLTCLKRCSRCRPKLHMPMKCKIFRYYLMANPNNIRMQLTVRRKPWRSTMWRRTLHPSSRKRWTKSRKLSFKGHDMNLSIYNILQWNFFFRYNPTWHCIVGRNFGSYVTHETRCTEVPLVQCIAYVSKTVVNICCNPTIRHFIYFYLGQVAVLLFKSGWMVESRLAMGVLLFCDTKCKMSWRP